MQRISLCAHLPRRACQGSDQASASLVFCGARLSRLGRTLVRHYALQCWTRAHLEDRTMRSSLDNPTKTLLDWQGTAMLQIDCTSACIKIVIEPSRQQYPVLHSWMILTNEYPWLVNGATSVALELPDVTFQGVAPSLVTTPMTSLPHTLWFTLTLSSRYCHPTGLLSWSLFVMRNI
jgi:hypothetical protein